MTLIDKRTAISTEWEKAFESQLASPAFAELPNRKDAELLLYQADGKVKALRSAIWRFSATGEESQKKTIALNKTRAGGGSGPDTRPVRRQGIQELASTR